MIVDCLFCDVVRLDTTFEQTKNIGLLVCFSGLNQLREKVIFEELFCRTKQLSLSNSLLTLS